MPSGAGVAFRHQRLSSRRCIRLLNLLPETEFCADLETTLYEVNLDTISDTREDTHYEALSYVWGSTVGTLPITCDSMTLLITPNCESALRHLRLKNRPRALWVDAICIDQERGEASVLERNAQVAMMGEIYSKATHTLCWLGPGNAFTDALMSRLERIGECPSQRGLQKLLHFDGK